MSCNRLILKTNAAVEIEDVISFYTTKNNILAKRIEKEIRLAFKAIVKNPESFQCRYSKIRMFWLNKFPYGLYYIWENDEVFIIAFWHSKEDVSSKLSKIL